MQLAILGNRQLFSKQTESLMERRIRFALTRFAPSIGGITVTLSNEAGPRGTPGKKCRVAVELLPRGSVVVESTACSFEEAACCAAQRASRSVARQLERKRHARRYQRRRFQQQQDVESESA